MTKMKGRAVRRSEAGRTAAIEFMTGGGELGYGAGAQDGTETVDVGGAGATHEPA